MPRSKSEFYKSADESNLQIIMEELAKGRSSDAQSTAVNEMGYSEKQATLLIDHAKQILKIMGYNL